MKKVDFIREISNKTNISQNNIKLVLQGIQEVVQEHIGDEDGVPLLDGLRVMTKVRPARSGRNPKTGESIEIPEKKLPKAKFGKTLKDVTLTL